MDFKTALIVGHTFILGATKKENFVCVRVVCVYTCVWVHMPTSYVGSQRLIMLGVFFYHRPA